MLDKLINKLSVDMEYFLVWRDNISIAIQDEFLIKKAGISKIKLKELADNSADRFLKLLCNGKG